MADYIVASHIDAFMKTTTVAGALCSLDIGNILPFISNTTITLSTHTTNISTNATAIANNAANIALHNTRITVNETHIDVLSADLATNTTRINILSTNVGILSTEKEILSTNQLTLSTKVAIISTNQLTLSTNVGVLSTNQLTLSTNVGVLSTNTLVLSSKVEALSTIVAVLSTNQIILSTNVGVLSTNTLVLSSKVDALSTGYNILSTNQLILSTNQLILSTNVGILSTNVGILSTNTLVLSSRVAAREFGSTGLIIGGNLSINADTTKFDVSSGSAIFLDYTNPYEPVSTSVNFGPFIATTTNFLTSGITTYIGINSSGGIVQQATPFTNSQRRSIVSLGVVIHSNFVINNAINIIGTALRSGLSQVHDFMEGIGILNTSGNIFQPNGSNLSLNKSSGTVFKFGCNFQSNPDDPHTLSIAAAVVPSFRYRTQLSVEGSLRTTLDPDTYEVLGALSAVPSGKFTVQRITMFQTGNIRLQYGQAVYNTIDDAKLGFENEAFTTEPDILNNGLLRAYVIIKQGATALNDITQAVFYTVSKFGTIVGSTGSQITSATIINVLGYTPLNTNFIKTSSATVDFPSIAGNSETTQTVTVPGALASLNGVVSLGWNAALPTASVVAQTWVSADHTVSIRLRNTGAGSIDPTPINVRVSVYQPS